MAFIFPYIGNNTPNWLIFFRGVETTNQLGIETTPMAHECAETPMAVRKKSRSCRSSAWLFRNWDFGFQSWPDCWCLKRFGKLRGRRKQSSVRRTKALETWALPSQLFVRSGTSDFARLLLQVTGFCMVLWYFLQENLIWADTWFKKECPNFVNYRWCLIFLDWAYSVYNTIKQIEATFVHVMQPSAALGPRGEATQNGPPSVDDSFNKLGMLICQCHDSKRYSCTSDA